MRDQYRESQRTRDATERKAEASNLAKAATAAKTKAKAKEEEKFRDKEEEEEKTAVTGMMMNVRHDTEGSWTPSSP